MDSRSSGRIRYFWPLFFDTMKRTILSLLVLGLFGSFSFAQNKEWTIQECIDQALESNLELKRNEVAMAISKSQLEQTKFSAYPNLNGNVSHAYNLGRSIDPFTNQFENQSVQSNAFNLTSSVTLFNAYKTRNNIKLSQNNVNANKEDKQALINSVSLRVADAYLQILFAEEQLEIAQNREALSLTNLKISTKRFQAGKTDKTELANMEAQYSNDQFQVLSAKNSIQMAKLTLLQLMQMPYQSDFKIAKPSINIESAEINTSLANIIDKVLNNFPEMRAARIRVEGAGLSEKIAKADQYPLLSLRANLNTVYSQSRKERINPTQSIVPIGLVEGTNETVVSSFTNYDFVTTAFGTQITDNFGQSVGFNLSIPIFNGKRVQNNIRISQLGLTREQINLENTKNQLINDVTFAYTQFINAKTEYFAAQKNYSTQKQTYELNKKSFDAGRINTSQLLVFRNNMDNAQNNLNRIKYQYIFAKLRLYFYEKNTIQLN